jgi:hypothetical protein
MGRHQHIIHAEHAGRLESGNFTTEQVFARSDLGKPLEWTGAIPRIAEGIDAALPEGMTVRGILEGRTVPL